MYQVKLGDNILYHPGSSDYAIYDTKLNEEVGLAGEFSFKVPPINPLQGSLAAGQLVTILKDGAEYWRGEIKQVRTDFGKVADVYCVEDLTWLADESIAPTASSSYTNAQWLQTVLDAYNQDRPDDRKFYPGMITNVGSMLTCNWITEYGWSILDCLRNCIAGDNGYIRVRRVQNSGQQATGVTLTFNENTATEASYDPIKIYYSDNGTWYVRTLSGAIGATSVYIPTKDFYFSFTSDGSVQNWGYQIASIVDTASGTPTDFVEVSGLPSVEWTTLRNTSTLPETEHPYTDGLAQYYHFALSVEPVVGIVRYIDILSLSNYGRQTTQPIQYGYNLLDYVKKIDYENLCNVVNPYGAETEEELYTDYNSRIVGSQYLSQASIDTYGRHCRAVIFDKAETVEEVNALAQAYVNKYSQPQLTMEVQAVDLAEIENIDNIRIGDSVRIIAEPFAVDQWLYLTKITRDLQNIDKNTITLAGDVITGETLTSQTQQTNIKISELNIPTKSSILDAARANALAILDGTNGGYVTFEVDSSDRIIELRIANNIDFSQATKCWRWNLGGLAYLSRSSAYDQWSVVTAATMDGGFVADFITTGTLNADLIRTGLLQGLYGSSYWNLDTGELYLSTDTSAGSQTLGEMQSSITANANGIATKVSAGDVSSMIQQSASSIRLQASEISWSSDYSSMTGDGVLTVQSGTFKGTINVGGASSNPGVINVYNSSGDLEYKMDVNGLTSYGESYNGYHSYKGLYAFSGNPTSLSSRPSRWASNSIVYYKDSESKPFSRMGLLDTPDGDDSSYYARLGMVTSGAIIIGANGRLPSTYSNDEALQLEGDGIRLTPTGSSKLMINGPTDCDGSITANTFNARYGFSSNGEDGITTTVYYKGSDNSTHTMIFTDGLLTDNY